MERTALILASLCSLTQVAPGQWSPPTLVANVNSPRLDYSPSPTFDGLTLYFTSDATGAGDIYRATRTSPYGTFGAPVQVTELATPQEEWSPCSRFDDREIFFSSQRPGGGGGGIYDLWRADRASTAVPFNPPTPVLELNSASFEYGPTLTLDGLRIYFTSDRPGGAGGTDIWTATRSNWFSPFGTPTPVAELNTGSPERDPRISGDNLVMFFARSNDLWMASRLDTSSPFSNIVSLAALNSTALDFMPGFGGTFHDELFFASARPGGPGSWDIYSSRFTGVIGFGVAGLGSAQDLRFSDPASPGRVYLAAASRGNSPGIPIDTRVLPLNPDLLLQLTIGGLPPIFTGYVGALDQNGIGAGRISFANFPGFTGLRFFSAFLVFDPSAPSGIQTISNAFETLVQ